MLDVAGARKHLYLSCSTRETRITASAAHLPLPALPVGSVCACIECCDAVRDPIIQWVNLCVDVLAIMQSRFPSVHFHAIESIKISLAWLNYGTAGCELNICSCALPTAAHSGHEIPASGPRLVRSHAMYVFAYEIDHCAVLAGGSTTSMGESDLIPAKYALPADLPTPIVVRGWDVCVHTVTVPSVCQRQCRGVRHRQHKRYKCNIKLLRKHC